MSNSSNMTQFNPPDLISHIGYPISWSAQLVLCSSGAIGNVYLFCLLLVLQKMDRAVRQLLANLALSLSCLCLFGIYRARDMLLKYNKSIYSDFRASRQECQLMIMLHSIPVNVSIFVILEIAIERYYANKRYYAYNENRAFICSCVGAAFAWSFGTLQPLWNYIDALKSRSNSTTAYCLQPTSSQMEITALYLVYLAMEALSIVLFLMSYRACRFKLTAFRDGFEGILQKRMQLRRVTGVTVSMAAVVLAHISCFIIGTFCGVLSARLQAPTRNFILELAIHTSMQLFAVLAVVLCVACNPVIRERTQKLFRRANKVSITLTVSRENETNAYFNHLDHIWKC